jgi:plastocyanin
VGGHWAEDVSREDDPSLSASPSPSLCRSVGRTTEVRLDGSSFRPSSVSVGSGDTIRFALSSAVAPHRIVAEGLLPIDGVTLSADQASFCVECARPGEFVVCATPVAPSASAQRSAASCAVFVSDERVGLLSGRRGKGGTSLAADDWALSDHSGDESAGSLASAGSPPSSSAARVPAAARQREGAADRPAATAGGVYILP